MLVDNNNDANDWRNKYDWSDKLILIVEDIEANHMFIAAALKRTSAQLLWAKDGMEAVEMCREYESIDLVLMDIRLPKLDGYEATRQIKEFRPKLPIIAQTAYVMSNEKGKVLQAGCDDLITKPIRLNVLISTIAKYIEE
ncbi:MAG: response regulator [Bacteroidetes bacterium CG2_30_33_31]|nr:MAG: response regulator [Bacteroidetes bacterium CG2_30_33_31]